MLDQVHVSLRFEFQKCHEGKKGLRQIFFVCVKYIYAKNEEKPCLKGAPCTHLLADF